MAVTTMPMTKTEKDCNRTGRRKNFRIIPLNDDYIGEEMSNITDSRDYMILVEIESKEIKVISRDERIDL